MLFFLQCVINWHYVYRRAQPAKITTDIMLSNSRNLVRLASRGRSGTKLFAATCPGVTCHTRNGPIGHTNTETHLHTHVDRQVTNMRHRTLMYEKSSLVLDLEV